MCRTFLANLLLAAAALSWVGREAKRADLEVAGTYLNAWDREGSAARVDRSKPIPWRTLSATACLRLERRGENEIAFEIVVNEASEHCCSADGSGASAFVRTIRGGEAKPLLETTRSEFLDCMSVSAYSLVALLRALLETGVLKEGGAAVTLSYAGAERVMPHPYRNIGVAKAALERIVRELAAELGRSHGLRVNAVRFSPWTRSCAGGAIPGLAEAMALSAERAPLGNASAQCLAREVVHLLRPGTAITGDVRRVDGGYHVLG